MKKYRVCNINQGLFADDTFVEANSPVEALKKLGYKHIKRDVTGKYGSIVVTGNRGVYVYYAKMEG